MYALTAVVPVDLPDDAARRQRFANPLDRALAAARLGRVTGVGWTADDALPDGWATTVGLRVSDRAAAARVVIDALAAAGGPPGTRLGDHRSDALLADITPAGPRVLVRPGDPLPDFRPPLDWQPGDVVGYRLTGDRWTLLRVWMAKPSCVVVSAVDWCGPALPPAAEAADLAGRPPGRAFAATAVVLDRKRVVEHREGPGYAWPVRPPVPSARRFAPTGARVRSAELVPAGWGLERLGPRELARFLRRGFGLLPVDVATRLHLDHGLGWWGPKPCLAVWYAGGRPVTPAAARQLFIAYCRAGWAADADPLPPLPPTPRLLRFAERMTAWDRTAWRDGGLSDFNYISRGDLPVPGQLNTVLRRVGRLRHLWGHGRPWDGQGYAVLRPADPAEFPAVWAAASAVGRACGLAVYDPVADRLAG